MGNMGWIGGVINILSGVGGSYETGKMEKSVKRAAEAGLPFLKESAGDMKGWGKSDWGNFKANYRPVADSLVTESNRAPDTEGAAGRASADSAQNANNIEHASSGAMFSHGIGPSSGSFGSMLSGVADSEAHDAGIGGAMAKLGAEDQSNHEKLSVINMGHQANDPTTTASAMGIVSAGGANYGKYLPGLAAQQANSMGQMGKGVGQVVGSFGGKSGGSSKGYTWGNQSDRNEANSQEAFMGSSRRYADGGEVGLPKPKEVDKEIVLEDPKPSPAMKEFLKEIDSRNRSSDDSSHSDGGLIRGPGDGTSDSVPAVIDGKAPARVSNGEYFIKADIAKNIGIDRLNNILAAARG